MKRALVPLLAAIVLLLPATTRAQYMYLDSDGDGVHTASDVISAQGTTNVTVWLRTDRSRDGTVATCIEPSLPLSIFSYVVFLEADAGTVNWGPFSNLFPDAFLQFFDRGDSTGWVFGYSAMVAAPPGLHRLASFSVSVRSGTPSIAIVRNSDLSRVDYTSFGSECYGPDFDNTLKLGSDWFDADGLAYSPGGSQNRAPLLQQPADMTVTTGEAAGQTLHASDADGNPLVFQKISGPAFLEVSTVDTGAGDAFGRVNASPRRADAGSVSPARVLVSDGVASDERSFSVSAVAGPDHAPRLVVPPQLTLVAGSVMHVPLYAGDSDGDPILFEVEAGPSYAALGGHVTGPAAATAALTLRPGPCDIGTAEIAIRAGDGTTVDRAAFAVMVKSSAGWGSHTVIPGPSAADISGLVLGDWNRDGHPDAAGSELGLSEISIYIGSGDGSFDAGSRLTAAGYTYGITAADFDRDGALDLAAASPGAAAVSLYRGNGDGTFRRNGDLSVHAGAVRPVAVDLNRDGWSDLVVGHQMANVVSVFLNDGSGGFPARADVPVPAPPYSVVVDDFDRDGMPDLATASGNVPFGVYVLRGFGDGFFADPRSFPADRHLMDMAPGDFNSDGIADLLAISFEARAWLLQGDGMGGFLPAREVPAGGDVPSVSLQFDVDVADWNGDGFADYLVSADAGHGRIHLGNGDGTFRDEALIPATGAVPMYGICFGDLNGDGWSDLAAGVWRQGTGATLTSVVNGGYLPRTVAARAFLPGAERSIAAVPSARQICFRFEPVDGSYGSSDVDGGSLRLVSAGTGSVEEIACVPPKVAREGDTDRDGVADLPACFAAADFARLFDQVHERRTVTARIHGQLRSGAVFCAPVEFEVVGSGLPDLAATVVPNPLNPSARLSFSTSMRGGLTVQVFDIQGRLVRTLLSRKDAPPDRYVIEIDGRDGAGRSLGSGVFFFRIESADAVQTGRFVILK